MKAVLIGKTKEYLCYAQPIMTCGTNCYIVVERVNNKALVIDPGDEAAALIATLEEIKAQPQLIVNTHGHWDHIGANKPLQQRYNLGIAIHELDAPLLGDGRRNAASLFGGDGDGGKVSRALAEGDIIELGALRIEVLHTPGHTPGGICLKLDKLLFSGDTLFKLSIGRTDFPGGDYQAMRQSLARLSALEDNFLVLPGHDKSTTLEYEKTHNPYLRP
ncbi:MAG: MBL fold metallo-hydrolase [Clostridiales bacterium]|nr:MBL fold metallo-hydrolase [Clostridiales bacterium]